MPKITRYGGASIAGEAGPELVNLPAGSPVEAAEPAFGGRRGGVAGRVLFPGPPVAGVGAALPAPAMSGPAKPRKDATVSPETARGRHERTD